MLTRCQTALDDVAPGGRPHPGRWQWVDECVVRVTATSDAPFDIAGQRELALAACRWLCDAVVAGGVREEPVDVEVADREGRPADRHTVVARLVRIGPTFVLATAEVVAAGDARRTRLLVTMARAAPQSRGR